MGEDASSMVSNTKRHINFALLETSSEYSNNSNSALALQGFKRPELGNISNNNVAVSPKFKGVVPQPNGNWGAQIYANHQRIWLGTFKSEKEAAMAYDSAAIKLRSGDSHRNFPWTEINVKEPHFQSLYTTDAILNMIKDGSYRSKFQGFIQTLSQKEQYRRKANLQKPRSDNAQYSCVQLFQKELTPSDVGKLNRLVIPKKYAVKFFPYISQNEKNEANNKSGVEDIEIVFYDKLTRKWKFRYCYWKSSQSFVFTRGWNRFVKEKKLKEKDIVKFYACGEGEQSFFLIDASHSGEESDCMNIIGGRGAVKRAEPLRQFDGDGDIELELNLGVKFSYRSMDKQESTVVKSKDHNKGFRLFGAHILE